MAGPTFIGSIPENYDRYIAALILEPFARDMVARVPRSVSSVLELACGTGLVTEKLRSILPPETRIVATDFSPDMVSIAEGKPGLQSGVEFKVADASELPFPANEFDMVLVHFGFMFFPDKPRAASEILRVLKPGGKVLLFVWDEIENNDVVNIGHKTIEELFSGNPPDFYRIPFSYHDQLEIRRVLRDAGFVDIAVTEVKKQLAGKAKDFATGLVHGNPISVELRDTLGADLDEVTAKVQNALAANLAHHPEGVKGKATALVAGGRKPTKATTGTPAPASEARAQTAPPRSKRGRKPAETESGPSEPSFKRKRAQPSNRPSTA